MIDTAIVLSAGFGTRLQPLSNVRPKALFPILNKPMLQWWMENLMAAGIKKVVVNIHHLAGQMLEYIKFLDSAFGRRLEIITSVEENILGTGGAVKKARDLLGDKPFLLVNSDIFTDFDIAGLGRSHTNMPGRLATMGLIDNPPTANVSLGESDLILAFRQPQAVAGEVSRLSYAGVMVLSPMIYDLIGDGFYDIIDVFNQAIKERSVLGGWRNDPVIWNDMGTPDSYWNINKELCAGRLIVHSSAQMSGARLEGWNIIADGCIIHPEAFVENSILWPGSIIGPQSVIKNAVICGNVPPGETLEGKVFCNVQA